MKSLRRMLDRIEPHFKEGGRLHRFYSGFEALDTFLYTPGETTRGPSHVRDALDMKRLMITVLVALTPCIFMAMYNTGYQANTAMASYDVSEMPGWRGDVIRSLGLGNDPASFVDNFVHGALYFLPIYIVTMAVGGLWEMLFSMVRGHEINEGFLVTGILFPLTLPPNTPLWQVAIGISFGVVIGKEVFGGTGRNFLNPALTGRAFLYFAHAPSMSGDRVWTAVSFDGFSAATPLGELAVAPINQAMGVVTDGLTWSQAFLGQMQGSLGETSTLACLLGALILVGTGIGSWRIMAGVLIGAMATATLFWLLRDSVDNPMFHMPPHWHLVVGGLAFGMVFMATDPVSASMTTTGKWIYGALIGAMTILIRVINPAFPEGVMLAILFGNVMAPLIDFFVVQANVKRRLAQELA